MDLAGILTDILLVLIAAKLAAEVSERVGIPAVVGEIVAGVVVGPSVLGIVGGHDEVLRTLGELGVILLLLEVGMEMDLAELGKVGRASLSVATVGVLAPLLLGVAVMIPLEDELNTAVFVAAALTATSVGITARVFGDLRALATTEARVVLGAAVADDVMGLVVLTVVVRLVTQGSVSVLSVLGIVAVALGFLVVGGLVGLRVAGPLFGRVERLSRSTGTLVALAFAFALVFARLADAARLAPIVGAFVAGIALGRVPSSDRIRRELAPVGHLFIPVFFLQIGIDADISAFGRATVLRDAALLLAVAVVGKLLSPLGAIGTRGDKALIGLGMLPRGEVGLIFATIGLQNGVLGDDLYASLLIVVLATTLITPPLLKARFTKLRAAARPSGPPADTPPPEGGWLRVEDGEIHLAGRPPSASALLVGLQAAVLAGRHRPSTELLEWLSTVPDDGARWGGDERLALLDVVERGNARGWRFLLTTGVLARALAEVDEAIRAREAEPFSLDASAAYRFPALERLRRLDADDPLAVEFARLADVDTVLCALLALEATDGGPDRHRVAQALAGRLGLDRSTAQRLGALVDDDALLWSAAQRPAGLSEAAVLPLASHLDTPERARAAYVVAALRHADAERWEHERVCQVHELIQAVLAGTGITGSEARTLLQQRRRDAVEAVGADPGLAARIDQAPAPLVLRLGPVELGRAAALVEPRPGPSEVAVTVRPAEDGWQVDVGAEDRPGLLAVVTGTLAELGLDVRRALVATWPDGAALETFAVTGERPAPELVAERITSAVGGPIEAAPLPAATIRFDDGGSPWHTICEVEAADRPGLLHQLATAFAAARVEVVSASIGSAEGDAVDVFELENRDGGKLTAADREAVIGHIREGVALRPRRLRRGLAVSHPS